LRLRTVMSEKNTYLLLPPLPFLIHKYLLSGTTSSKVTQQHSLARMPVSSNTSRRARSRGFFFATCINFLMSSSVGNAGICYGTRGFGIAALGPDCRYPSAANHLQKVRSTFILMPKVTWLTVSEAR